MPLDHPSLGAASASLEAVYGTKPVFIWEGGTLPVAADFRALLGMWTLGYAFGEPDNGLHAPNEFFRLETLRRGTLATVRLLHELGQHGEELKRS